MRFSQRVRDKIVQPTGTVEYTNPFPYVSAKFIDAINDIGKHGHEKYGDYVYHATRQPKARRKDGARWTSRAMCEHADAHFYAYTEGCTHDHFGTRRHDLAAVAYNAMLEFLFAGLDEEEFEEGVEG